MPEFGLRDLERGQIEYLKGFLSAAASPLIDQVLSGDDGCMMQLEALNALHFLLMRDCHQRDNERYLDNHRERERHKALALYYANLSEVA